MSAHPLFLVGLVGLLAVLVMSGHARVWRMGRYAGIVLWATGHLWTVAVKYV